MPCRSNLILVRSASGKYVSGLPMHTIYSLCRHYNSGQRLTFSVIRNALRPVWPKGKPIASIDVSNTRLKIIRMAPTASNCATYQVFDAASKDSSLLEGLDDQFLVTDDEAYELAHDVCADLTSGNPSSCDDVFFCH